MGKRKERAYGDGRVFQPKGSKKWMVAWFVNGKEVRRSAGTESEAAAHDFLRKMLGDKVDGRPVPVTNPVTFEDMATLLVNDYEVNGRRSLDRAKRSLHHLRLVFGLHRAVDLKRDRVNAYIAERLKAKAAPATVQKELAALGRMFSLAVEAELLPVAPRFKRLKVENTRTVAFTEAELDAVLNVLTHGRPATAMDPEVKAQPDLVPAIVFAAATGWRIGSDVFTLQWRQVDFAAGTVTRWSRGTVKARESIVFPFGVMPDLKALLERQRERTTALERANGRIVSHVFHRNGKPVRSCHAAFRSVCRAAGIPGRIPHDLRRTGARTLRALGMGDRDIAELCGWETTAMVARYLGRDPAGVADRLRLKMAEAGRERKEAQR